MLWWPVAHACNPAFGKWRQGRLHTCSRWPCQLHKEWGQLVLLVKHRFLYAAQTGFELSLRYQPLKQLELEVHTSVHKCNNQKIQWKKKKSPWGIISSVTTSGFPQSWDRNSSPLNLSSLLELQIPQKSGKNLPMALGKDSPGYNSLRIAKSFSA